MRNMTVIQEEMDRIFKSSESGHCEPLVELYSVPCAFLGG